MVKPTLYLEMDDNSIKGENLKILLIEFIKELYINVSLIY